MTVAVGAVIDDPHDVAGAAAEAEKAGYDYIACGEHLLFHGETPNSFVRLATAAGATQRVRLMNTVAVAPLYPPALFAKLVADLDVVSGERLELGVGLGGESPAEFEAVGVDPSTRAARTDKVLELIWGIPNLASRGLDIAPSPRKRPLVWIGGRKAGALRRTARFGDGWMPYLVDADHVSRGLAMLRELGSEARGESWQPRVGVFVFVALAPTRDEGRALLAEHLSALYATDMSQAAARYGVFGTPDQCVDALHAYIEAGVDTVIAKPVAAGSSRARTTALYESVLARVKRLAPARIAAPGL